MLKIMIKSWIIIFADTLFSNVATIQALDFSIDQG